MKVGKGKGKVKEVGYRGCWAIKGVEVTEGELGEGALLIG